MLQWTPLLLVVSMFACENTHSVALGLYLHDFRSEIQFGRVEISLKNVYTVIT